MTQPMSEQEINCYLAGYACGGLIGALIIPFDRTGVISGIVHGLMFAGINYGLRYANRQFDDDE